MKNSKEEIFLAGVDFTPDSFLMETCLVFRKTKTEYVRTPIALIQTTSNTYHVYDLSTKLGRTITSEDFFKLLKLYQDTGGLTKREEEYLYDKVIDNNFAMYCLLTSMHM